MTGKATTGDRREGVPPEPRKYYTLDIDFKVAGASPMREWVNQKEQMKGYHSDASKPFRGLRFSEAPRIRFDRKGRRGAFSDADSTGLPATWLVSDRLKTLLERIDPEALVFQQSEIDYSNFPQPGPWLLVLLLHANARLHRRSALCYPLSRSNNRWLALIHVSPWALFLQGSFPTSLRSRRYKGGSHAHRAAAVPWL
jgi:hypothetical protein